MDGASNSGTQKTAGSVADDSSVVSATESSKAATKAAAAEVMKQLAKYESDVGLAYSEIPKELCEGQVRTFFISRTLIYMVSFARASFSCGLSVKHSM